MKFLNDILKRDPDYAGLLSDAEKGRLPAVCTGLSLIHKAAAAAALCEHTGRKIVIVCNDETSANELKDDLVSMGFSCLNFPSRDYCIGELAGYSKEYEHKRTDTLSKLSDGDFDMLTVSLDAAVQYTMPPDILSRARFTLKTGDSLDMTVLADRLVSAGYVRSELCEGLGQFSVRGGIFDIFPVNSAQPCRIEFWGDEIDSIAYFDAETQRRTESAGEINVTPACEVIYDSAELAEKLQSCLDREKYLTPAQKSSAARDIDALKNGVQIPPDRYIPLIYPGGETIFDYTDGALMIISESGGINERFKAMEIQQQADVEGYLEQGFLSSLTARLWLDRTDFFSRTGNAVIMENFPRVSYDTAPKDIINFNFKRSSAWSGDIQVLLEDISYILDM